jgi:hypothetical protein
MRRMALSVLAASMLSLSQAPASAGGWWTTLDLHDQYLGTGESFTIKVREILFDSIEAAERAEHTAYFAYLVKDFDRRALDRAMSRPDPKNRWRPFGPVVQVGIVTPSGRDANLSRGSVDIDVPDVAPGAYWIMLCDAGCRTPLGNHIPVPVNVISDALAAQTARRFHQANERLTFSLAQVRGDVRRMQRKVRELRADAADAVAEPEPTVVIERATSRPSWIPYAGWFVAGAAVALIFARRRREEKQLPEILIEPAPDDARELIETST